MLLALVATALLFLCAPAAQQDTIVIRKHQAGPVALGASAQAIYAAFRGRSRLIDLALEGQLSPALELTFPETGLAGGVVAELVPRDSALTVWRIAVTNPRVRTEKGVGVGSSVTDLRAHYTITSVGSGEGRVFVRVDELAASFELDTTGPGGDTLWRVRDPAQVPGHIKIVSILLTQ